VKHAIISEYSCESYHIYVNQFLASSLGPGIDNANHDTGGPTSTTTIEEYEVPVVTLNQAGSQEANYASVYQDVSQPYETVTTTSRDMEKHIYHVLETSTEVTQCVHFLCVKCA
jgi:hypothetical protein